jgi:hypothetical protein
MIAIAIVFPFFYALTARSPRRFIFIPLPHRRVAIGFLFRGLALFWCYSIAVNEALFYFRDQYWPLVLSSLCGFAAVYIFFIGVDSTFFQSHHATSSQNA